MSDKFAVFFLLALGSVCGCDDKSENEPRQNSQSQKAAATANVKSPQEPSVPIAQLVAQSFGFDGELTSESFDPAAAGYDRIGEGVWGCTFKDRENAFARAMIILFKGGSHVTPEKTRQFEEGAAKQSKLQSELDDDSGVLLEDTYFRIFEMSPNRKAYGYVAGFGPGGVGYAVSWTSPTGEYDVFIEASYSTTEPLVETEATKEYHQEIHERPLALLEKASRVLDAALFEMHAIE